ncbi:hypothetical protein ACFRCX_30285 [Streptomyces sp. NPDC056652]|uniref:hypothetical protein n=1 Tax=Streptomyces sp. NPDC056652 TaxID=3345893 RepID=UPI0036914537
MTDIGLELAQLKKRLTAVERQARLSSASLDDAALVVRDSAGGLRAIVGQQGDGTTAVTVVNGGPPPAPSTPTAGPALGGIAAGWDGTFANGAIIPMDWARVEVHASPTADFTPTTATLQATIETAQGGIVYIPATSPQYVRLLARNTSGAASVATDTVGPYTPRPVAGDIGVGEITATLIADGAVTTPKLFANAVTTAKLSAGSVDATALKADAITGKTITGGTINGAEFHSDNGLNSLVDIADGIITTTAANGWQVIIDPSNFVPVVYFLDNTGKEIGAINATGVTGLAGLLLSSGPITDGAVTDYKWATIMKDSSTTVGGVWQTRRLRDSDNAASAGGYIHMDNNTAQFAVYNSATAEQTLLQLENHVAVFDDARVFISPIPGSAAALSVDIPTAGQTGFLLYLRREASAKFTVDKDGNTAALGGITATGSLTGADLVVSGASQGWGRVAFQARSTATTAGSTEAVALTQTGVVLRTGRAYRVQVRGLAQAATAAAGVRVRVRKTNTSGAVWLDTFTVATPAANTNVQYANQQIIVNTTGSTITTDLVMTWVTASGGGNSFLNAGAGFYTAFEVTDIGAATDFSTAQSVT